MKTYPTLVRFKGCGFTHILELPRPEHKEAAPLLVDAIAQAKKDARIYGAGYLQLLPDGTVRCIDPANISGIKY